MSAIKDQGDRGEQFLKTLEESLDVTLFAPCNNALEGDLTLNTIMSDRDKFMDILKMHVVVDDKLYQEKIMKKSVNGVSCHKYYPKTDCYVVFEVEAIFFDYNGIKYMKTKQTK